GFSCQAFWAPSSTPLPATALATTVRQGNGGQTATCTPGSGVGIARASALARSTADCVRVFIFQLPATNNRLMEYLSPAPSRSEGLATRDPASATSRAVQEWFGGERRPPA